MINIVRKEKHVEMLRSAGFRHVIWSQDENFIPQLQEFFVNGSLKTDIQGSFPLAEYDKALMQYIRSMSEGKVLLLPQE